MVKSSTDGTDQEAATSGPSQSNDRIGPRMEARLQDWPKMETLKGVSSMAGG